MAKKANKTKIKNTREAKEKKEIENGGKNLEKQLIAIFVIMAAIIAITAGVYFTLDKLKKFEYGGLKFQKIVYGKLPLYYSRIPISDKQGNIAAYYNMYLRNDPRKLRDIPVVGRIRLTANTIVQIDDNITGCPDYGIAGVTLGYFFRAAGIKTEGSYTNKTLAEDKGLKYVNCNDDLNQSLIVIKQSDKNEIRQESKDCYTINFKECDVNRAVERFIVAASAHSKGIQV